MEMITALQAFTALGHPGRLATFRLLMRMAPGGARPTEIAEALGVKANTLSHHLNGLMEAGLIACDRRGRSLVYAVDLDRAQGLADYLVNDCLRGRPDLAPHQTRAAPFRVLFLCSGNSARSIFAEALLRDLGGGRFQALSAGTRPSLCPHPLALEILTRNGHDTAALRSKPLAEVQGMGLDFIFTVCDTAAAEECPPWPGQPISGHWGLPDPVKALGTAAERALAFAQTYAGLRRRIEAFAALPIEALDRAALQSHIDHLSKE